MSGLQSKRPLCLVLDFPPPITGASKNNRKMADLFAMNKEVYAVDTSAKDTGLRRSLPYHLERIKANLRAAAKLLWRSRRGKYVAYHVPNAGRGMVYTFLLFVSLRPVISCLILHYRGFTYIDSRSKLLTAILWVYGKDVTHVFLSEGMRSRFERTYKPNAESDAYVISNAALLDFPVIEERRRDRNARLKLGHLSNLCSEKGLDDVIELFRLASRVGYELELWLAGPAADDIEAEKIHRIVADYPSRVRWLGAVQGEEKIRFYDSIDLFLFPTRYAVEAEPNVVLEAMARGVPVAANNRGCISEMLTDGCLTSSHDDKFCREALKWIGDYSDDRKLLSEVSANCVDAVRSSKSRASVQLGELVAKT